MKVRIWPIVGGIVVVASLLLSLYAVVQVAQPQSVMPELRQSRGLGGITAVGVTASGNTIVSGTLTVSGTSALNNGITVDTSAFSVANATGNTVVSGTLTVTGTQTLVGNTSHTGADTIGTFLVLSKAANITVTDGSTITPTASYQPITAGGAVGTSSIAILSAGTLLRLVNVGSNAITISDTGTTMLSGDIALGQYDSLLLMSDGTNWIQMGTSNN